MLGWPKNGRAHASGACADSVVPKFYKIQNLPHKIALVALKRFFFELSDRVVGNSETPSVQRDCVYTWSKRPTYAQTLWLEIQKPQNKSPWFLPRNTRLLPNNQAEWLGVLLPGWPKHGHDQTSQACTDFMARRPKIHNKTAFLSTGNTHFFRIVTERNCEFRHSVCST